MFSQLTNFTLALIPGMSFPSMSFPSISEIGMIVLTLIGILATIAVGIWIASIFLSIGFWSTIYLLLRKFDKKKDRDTVPEDKSTTNKIELNKG